MESHLYIVATPIGNLEDISLRALRILKEVDTVFAEDTREARKLFSHFEIPTSLERYDEHSHSSQIEHVVRLLDEGKNVAYVSDAGTPGISDPGKRLVEEVRARCPEVQIVPLPGASAITTLLSASGLTADSFIFLGFVPHKKGRETLFKRIQESDSTVVMYESPHRIMKTLESLQSYLSDTRTVVVGRELTKMYEEIISGPIEEVYTYYVENPDKVRGEFVVAVEV